MNQCCFHTTKTELLMDREVCVCFVFKVQNRDLVSSESVARHYGANQPLHLFLAIKQSLRVKHDYVIVQTFCKARACVCNWIFTNFSWTPLAYITSIAFLWLSPHPLSCSESSFLSLQVSLNWVTHSVPSFPILSPSLPHDVLHLSAKKRESVISLRINAAMSRESSRAIQILPS